MAVSQSRVAPERSNMRQLMKEFMSKNSLNQRQLANHLGVGESQLNRWLVGKNKPGVAWTIIIKQKLS